jgi:hypothetical protein
MKGELASHYVGLTEADAKKLAEFNGRRFRVAARDGVAMFLTRDIYPSRINVSLVDGKVVEVRFG